jgi:toxin ParE1/3/4
MSKVTLTFEVMKTFAPSWQMQRRSLAVMLPSSYVISRRITRTISRFLSTKLIGWPGKLTKGCARRMLPTPSGSRTKMLRRTCSASARNYLGGSPSKSVIGESILAGDALAQRDANIAHIAQEDARAALRQLDEIERQTNRLAKYPELGRPSTRSPSARLLSIARTPFLIAYRIRPRARRVEIFRFIHTSQNWNG